MELSDSITQAQDWTRRLCAALEADDTAGALDLMAGRAAAMAALENAHRAADDGTVEACRARLIALQQEDAELQKLAADALSKVDQACREDLGAAPAGSSAYRGEPALACLDRRA